MNISSYNYTQIKMRYKIYFKKNIAEINIFRAPKTMIYSITNIQKLLFDETLYL